MHICIQVGVLEVRVCVCKCVWSKCVYVNVCGPSV